MRPEVAEPVPLAVKCSARQIRVAEVAEEHVRPSRDYLPFLPLRQEPAVIVGDRDLDAVQRSAVALQHVLGPPGPSRGGHVALAGSEDRAQVGPERVGDVADEVTRDRGTPGRDIPQGSPIAFPGALRGNQVEDERGRGEGVGAPVSVDQRQPDRAGPTGLCSTRGAPAKMAALRPHSIPEAWQIGDGMNTQSSAPRPSTRST